MTFSLLHVSFTYLEKDQRENKEGNYKNNRNTLLRRYLIEATHQYVLWTFDLLGPPNSVTSGLRRVVIVVVSLNYKSKTVLPLAST
jgi:hypothetical protein